MDGENILGWEIVKEDGTIMRFGNYNINNGTFTLTNNESGATRCMLGFNGLVKNVDPKYYDSLNYIPYQWDVSDIQQVNGKHTTILYQQKRVNLRLGVSASNKYYTRESHPWKILDNMGGEIEFILGTMDTTEYYGDSTTYMQYTFEEKYLDSLVFKRNGSIYQTINLQYKTFDYLNIGAKKRYLREIAVRDRHNKTMSINKYDYWGSIGVNSGAIKQVTSPNGKKVLYHYKTQPLKTNLIHWINFIRGKKGY